MPTYVLLHTVCIKHEEMNIYKDKNRLRVSEHRAWRRKR